MPQKQSFDAELAALEELRAVHAEAAEPGLAKALAHRNNFLVAKAAALVLHHWLVGLTPQLTSAFGRFLENGAKTDPQCWAKNALAKTLAAFECQDSELFLAGMRYVQLEPGWGGAADSAGALRGACALALVQCRELSSHCVLMALTPLFADGELSVRIDSARAVQQVGGDAASLLLRLRAELGSADPELLGTCFTGVLALEGAGAIPWAARFLRLEGDAAAEAAMAMAQTHSPEAFTRLRDTFQSARDPWFRSAVLAAVALTRRAEATDWLVELATGGQSYARDAHEALCRSAPSEAALTRLRQAGMPCP